jgi:hypothetical protein
MIYGEDDLDQYNTAAEDNDLLMDCNRYDVHPSKLDKYLKPAVKKLLKSKFVTG